MSSQVVLGISAYYHDSAAAIIVDGEIVAAVQEERFSRIKGDSSFPVNSVNFCLNAAQRLINEVDYIVFYENPLQKFERLLTCYHLTAPANPQSFITAMPKWLTVNLWLEFEIQKELGVKKPITFCDHHLSHAASAFYPSPFERAAILTIDGVGEWSTTAFGVGNDNEISLSKHICYPNSLGLLYSAFTYYLGFKINSGEYKVMGLAPYGKPQYVDLIKEKLIQIAEDGSVILNQYYFSFVNGLTMVNKHFNQLFGGAPRKPESPITQKEKDLAASIQLVTNEIVCKMARYVKMKTKQTDLVLAGGVALNSVAMGILVENKIFDNVWVQPAAGDAGGALGAALWCWYQKLNNKRTVDPKDKMQGSFLGPEVDDLKSLLKFNATWKEYSDLDLAELIAHKLDQGKVIGLVRGRMEYGPRALGSRSILADARDPKMWSMLNQKIKFREDFRPFAPMVIQEDASKYFCIKNESPYMLFVFPVVAGMREIIPAVTHLDNSARVQTIDKNRSPFMYKVLDSFKKITNCSVIINTSFNVRGEPIVNTAEDAYRCFMATDMDCLVIGNNYFEKDAQGNCPLNEKQRAAWLRRFDHD